MFCILVSPLRGSGMLVSGIAASRLWYAGSKYRRFAALVCW
jgi:hypothetical protein